MVRNLNTRLVFVSKKRQRLTFRQLVKKNGNGRNEVMRMRPAQVFGYGMSWQEEMCAVLIMLE